MKTKKLLNERLYHLAMFTILPLLIVVAGCGGPPANNPLLTDARETYDTAHNDESIVRLAPVELKEAEEALAKKVKELEARPTDRGLVLTLGDVLFDFGQATLKSGGMQTVNQLGDFLNEYPERQVLIEGFTDSIGSEAFNQALSAKRAENVKNALMNYGVRSDRIRIRGYGTQHPVASNETEDGRRQNRRVEVVISDQDGIIKARTGPD